MEVYELVYELGFGTVILRCEHRVSILQSKYTMM